MRLVRRFLLLTGLVVGCACLRADATFASPEAEPAQIVEQCPDPVDPVVPATMMETEALLIGTWIECAANGVFDRLSPSEVGIEFRDDGRWFRVFLDGAGGLIRADGLDVEGSWSVRPGLEPDNPPFSVSMSVLGGLNTGRLVQFYGSPNLADFDSGALYVPWTGPAPVSGTPSDIGTGPCGLPRDPVALSSVAQVEELLPGTWLSCGGITPFGSPQFAEVGIHFEPDGHFFRLYELDDGTLISATGPDQEGTWTVFDTTEMNGPGSYQVDIITLDGGAGQSGRATFLQSPRHFRLSTTEFFDFFATNVQPEPGSPPTPPSPQPPPDAELPPTGATLALVAVALAAIQFGIVLVRLGTRRAR